MQSHSEFSPNRPLPYELEHEAALRAIDRVEFVIQDPFLDGLLEETHQFLRNERATFPIDPLTPPTDENPGTIGKDSYLAPPSPSEELDQDPGKDNQGDQAQQ